MAAAAKALKQRGLHATPQALAALAESVLRSDPEYLGDTDTLLAGLLLTGSYAVDVLEQAGINRAMLTQLTLDSVRGVSKWNPKGGSDEDPFEHGFGPGSAGEHLFGIASASKAPIDAADMLRAALTLEGGESRIYGRLATGAFPFELRKDSPPDAPLMQALEERLAECLIFSCTILSDRMMPSKMLRTRKTPINEMEDWRLDKEFGGLFRGMTIDELEFVIRALNSWFVSRTILTSPTRLCLKTINRFTALLFAPTYFVNSGGDLGTVEAGLGLARRLAPARDLPFMALFLHKGNVHAGHFTYRDSLLVPDHSASRIVEAHGVQLYSPRPVPLVASTTLFAFERLLSSPDLNQTSVVQFLRSHPELLLSLGYSTAISQVCFREADAKALVPDFILEVPGGRGVDLLGLASPRAPVLTRDPLARMSNELVRAVAELRNGAKYFEDANNRKLLERTYGLVGFRPQGIVVIGREREFASKEERMEIEEQLGKVKLFTYDNLIEYARTRLIDIPSDDVVLNGMKEHSRPVRQSLSCDVNSRPAIISSPVEAFEATEQGRISMTSVIYDVALSFAGEDREVARRLAEGLKSKGIRVFYDEYEQAMLWGKDLYAHLSDVYSHKARYCVMILSVHYASKLWTNHERRAAQERAFREREEYILPLRIDDTSIPGVLATTGYLDLRIVDVEVVISSLIQKLSNA